jgi:hypothetical protein
MIANRGLFKKKYMIANIGLLKKKYTLSKIYFTSTIKRMAICYIETEGRTLKVIFTP